MGVTDGNPRRAAGAVRAAVGWTVRRAAPRSMSALTDLGSARDEFGDVSAHLRALTDRVSELEEAVVLLREEIDETRRDGRRVAELYDLVFERLGAPASPPQQPGAERGLPAAPPQA
ncbi:MAG TPA: hypothetical protein VIL55_02930 [Naasia sp.]